MTDRGLSILLIGTIGCDNNGSFQEPFGSLQFVILFD